MEYDFLIDTYETERLKTLGVWSTFTDDDLPVRPHPLDKRDRNALEHMVHQCLSENKWFCNMFGIDVGAPPLPKPETRIEFIKQYAEDSGKRLDALKKKDKAWWEAEVSFFGVAKSRAWIMLRRIAHTAHHRGNREFCSECWKEKFTVCMGHPSIRDVCLKMERSPYTHIPM